MTEQNFVTQSSTLAQIKSNLTLKKLYPYFIFDNTGGVNGVLNDDSKTLQSIQSAQPTWNADDMAAGLNEILNCNKTAEEMLVDVYDANEIEQDCTKQHVKLVRFFAHEPKMNRCAILCSGGAYGSVCNLSEGFEVAADLAKMGIDAFCLTYRVGGNMADGSSTAPLLPKPQHDLCAAVKYLCENQKKLNINMNNYCVCGFSAGAHVAGCFGLEDFGYTKNELPSPAAILLTYPLLNLTHSIGNMPDPVFSIMAGGLFGPACNHQNFEDLSKSYNVDQLATGNYPPTFVVQAKDDPLIDWHITNQFCQKLNNIGVPCSLSLAKTGGHGYGNGNHTSAAGWVKQAVEFWMAQTHACE